LCSAFHYSVGFVITAADRPFVEPRNCPKAGTKSPLDRPCKYNSGSTSVIFGVLRAHAGRIAEANRFGSPVSGSVRLSLTPWCSHLHHAGAGQHFT
jgi:hypothetical protein